MKKESIICKLILTLFTLVTSLELSAQVNGFSLILSPTAEYTWWDKNISIENTCLYGGKVGFGFGPILELRGYYLKNTNANFKSEANLLNIKSKLSDKLDLTRYGGDLKINIVPNSFFSPYLIAGGGVQSVKIKDLKSDQLFVDLGAGLKFNLSDRVVLSAEAKNVMFNVSGKNYIIIPSTQQKVKGIHTYNWTAVASLDFYLGGRVPKHNEISREYKNMFSDGFKGVKFVLEPSVSYIDFSNKLALLDTYMLGGSVGLDLSSFIGIRGFYYQATKDPKKISLSFNNDLAIYGGKLITRLNVPRGITPYLEIGGGYMKVGENYISTIAHEAPNSSAFALGGAGIEIPLSKYIALFGTVDAIFTANDVKEKNIQNIKQVNTSVMYNGGVRLNLGKAANGERKYKEKLIDDINEHQIENTNQRINNLRSKYEKELGEYDVQLNKYEDRINTLKEDYESRIKDLNRKLKTAIAKNDTLDAIEIEKQRVNNKQALENIENEELTIKRRLLNQLSHNTTNTVKLTRTELDILVQKIIDEASNEAGCHEHSTNINLNENNKISNDEVKREIELLNKKINKLINQISEKENKTIIYTTDNNKITPIDNTIESKTVGNYDSISKLIKLNRIGIFTGLGFGNLTSWNVGIRGYLPISNTNLDFMPELYTAIASNSGLGISANVVYNLNISSFGKIKPYIGAGLGVFHGKKTVFGSNFIFGASMDCLQGKIFADYSMRGLTKQNQIAVGYSFIF